MISHDLENRISKFIDGAGARVLDLRFYVHNWLKEHPNGEIYVGADSKVRGDQVKYSTVVCMWDVGRGVTELHLNEIEPKPKDDGFTRLWSEVTKAVEIADSLKEVGDITVHVDLNENPQFKSHRLFDASIGLITSMGFKAEGKPFSWAASCGAHRHCQ